jgi:uncharacterized protein (DUF433 family)
MRSRAPDIYAGKDPREVPIYSIADASHYLRIPASTLRTWVHGRAYETRSGNRRSAGLIAGVSRGGLLSFWQLVEGYVLASIRRGHGLRLDAVRRAIAFVRKERGLKRPLLEQEFETDGVSLFVERWGQLINASEEGQVAMRAVLAASLRRIDRDPEGLPVRLYPWMIRPRTTEEERRIVVDPRRAFGRPTLVDTGVRVSILADRWAAGDSIDTLADDYGLARGHVEVAVRWGSHVAQAA